MSLALAQRSILSYLHEHGDSAWPTLSTEVAMFFEGAKIDKIRTLNGALDALVKIGAIKESNAIYALSGVGRKAMAHSSSKAAANDAGHPIEYIEPMAVRLRAQMLQMERVLNCRIAGSIRRRKERCRDIELVALLRPPELLREQQCPHDALRARALTIHKSGEKYTQVTIKAPDPLGQVKIDLFTTEDPAQWGALFAIRTGSADFIRRGLAHWKKITDGGYCKNNRLHQADGTQVNTTTEDLFFAALGCRRTPKPEERS